MTSQKTLKAEFQRLLEEDKLDEAEAVLALIEPVSDEEWLQIMHQAPWDDEPLTDRERRVFEEFERSRGLAVAQRPTG